MAFSAGEFQRERWAFAIWVVERQTTTTIPKLKSRCNRIIDSTPTFRMRITCAYKREIITICDHSIVIRLLPSQLQNFRIHRQILRYVSYSRAFRFRSELEVPFPCNLIRGKSSRRPSARSGSTRSSDADFFPYVRRYRRKDASRTSRETYHAFVGCLRA